LIERENRLSQNERQRRHTVKRITRCLGLISAPLILSASPVVAADQSVASGEPVRMTDSELDEVTAGEFLLDLNLAVHDTHLNLGLYNTSVNAAAIIQANVVGDSVQYGEATAMQSSTQLVSAPG
jgi:hypothetical protein